MDIGGQVSLVTGAGSGLGQATAHKLADLGARVAVVDIDSGKAGSVAAAVGGRDFAADVTNPDAMGRVFDDVAATFGAAPRVVVNCAGIGPAARVVARDGQLSLELFEKVLRVNLLGTYTVMSLAARAMMALDPLEGDERGVIVNTASVAIEDGQVGQTAYAASKGGIAAMTLPAARELARAGIRVMCVAPGLFRTPMMEGLPAEAAARIAGAVPFPARLGKPEEFAQLVSQIVANAYLNGTVIRLDGAVRLPAR